MSYLAKQVGPKRSTNGSVKPATGAAVSFFDCVVRTVLVTRGESVSNDLNVAAMIRAIVEEPRVLDSDKAVREWFPEAIKQRRSSILFDVASDMNNYDERADKLDVNPLLLEVTSHWVDCHCPMWLMSRKAILSAAKAFAQGNDGWSEESLKRVLREGICGSITKTPIKTSTNLSRLRASWVRGCWHEGTTSCFIRRKDD